MKIPVTYFKEIDTRVQFECWFSKGWPGPRWNYYSVKGNEYRVEVLSQKEVICMSKGKTISAADELEINFDLNNRLWEDYLEWCETGYIVRDEQGFAVALSTKPSPKDFEVWKTSMGYFSEEES